MMDFALEVPGSYVIVDHSIFRAFNKGALAILKVDRAESKAIYSGKEVRRGLPRRPGPAQPGRGGGRGEVGPVRRADGRRAVKAGHALFAGTCSTCHQASGAGLAGIFPPLAKSDWLAANHKGAVDAVLHGMSGKLKST